MQVVVRLVEIADRILSACDIDGLVRHHLDLLSMQEAFLLLGNHVGNPGLAGAEIIPQFLHLVCILALLHFRKSLPLLGDGIVCSAGIDGAGLHVIFHEIGREFHVVVFDVDFAVVIYFPLSVGEDLDDRVFRTGECRSIERALLLKGGGVDLEKGIRFVDRIADGPERVGDHDAVRMVFDRLAEGRAVPPVAPVPVLGLSGQGYRDHKQRHDAGKYVPACQLGNTSFSI